MTTFTPIPQYQPQPQPALQASEREWVLRELQKLSGTIRQLIAAIEELRALHP
jgi:hypothetical protein